MIRKKWWVGCCSSGRGIDHLRGLVAPAGKSFGGSALPSLEGEDEAVNSDSLSERHSDNGDGEDVAEGTWVAADSLRRAVADESDTDTSTGTSENSGT